MSFQDKPGIIHWCLHFSSSPERVYEALATDEGRSSFWAESAPEDNGFITFHILNFEPFTGRILQKSPDTLFELEYFGSEVRFELVSDGKGGTDLQLTASNVPESYRMEMAAGWVSVLMAMRAALDFGVDLRNHDASRTWKQGYADN